MNKSLILSDLLLHVREKNGIDIRDDIEQVKE